MNDEKALKIKLEKEGEQKVSAMLKTQPEKEQIGQQCINIITQGAAEYKEKTGRDMTYSEMRELYG
jgi:hypothetical protein